MANSNIRGSDANVAVRPLAATQLSVGIAARVAVGVSQNVIVAALDPYGNIDPNFTGTVSLVSTDTAAVLPPPYTFGPTDAGQTGLSVALFSAGSQTLTAQSNGLSGQPAATDVFSGNAVKLGVSGLASGRAGRVQSLVLQALDNFNTLVPGYVESVQLTSGYAGGVSGRGHPGRRRRRAKIGAGDPHNDRPAVGWRPRCGGAEHCRKPK